MTLHQVKYATLPRTLGSEQQLPTVTSSECDVVHINFQLLNAERVGVAVITRLVFGRCSVRISASILLMLTEWLLGSLPVL
jgi:hypothetical protein